ncbi:MAG TPA: tetratricopeptide repeat protein [Planctomycetaceae bacterium]|nr:tetratricopeptide repeat protein [Planctomycetaceae bacterium]
MPSTAVLTGERVAFTGTLASMTHKQAADIVEQHGGEATQHVSQQTTLLVIGEEGWPLEEDGQPSVKLLQAQSWQQRGSPVRFLSESEWLTAVGLQPTSRPEALQTPAMLSQLLGVSVHDVRRWERTGLIHAVRRVCRLPYFDIEEVAAARRVERLLSEGVPLERVVASLHRLEAVMPSVARPLAQLQILAQGHRVLYRDPAGWLDSATGQRVFAFDEEPLDEGEPEVATIPLPNVIAQDRHGWTSRQWFDEGGRLADDGQLTAAIEAYRLALIESPAEAEFHFHLADVLYRLGRTHAAIERYYAAVEHDHDFIEAWTQLGCVLEEVGELVAARDAFGVALDRHPDFPEAHFHLAQVLERTGQPDTARDHWQAYLTFEQHGPWADVARERLATQPLG